MPVLVRNTAAGPTVFHDKQSDVSIEWGPAGDPTGEDIQMVPDDLVKNINFMKALNKGIIRLEDADQQKKIEQMQRDWQDQQERARQASADSIVMEENKDLVILPCIGPGDRGGQCGADVPVREKQKYDRPALCSRHKALEGEYVVSDSEKLDGEGKPEGVKVWSRVGMTRRAVEQTQSV